MPNATSADRAAIAGQLRIVVARVGRGLRQQLDEGLTPSQEAVLASIARYGPLTPSELAEHERIARPTITRLIARLKERGLVTVEADPRDGRSYRVQISQHGRAMRQQRRRRKDAYLLGVLAAADADEVELLGRAAELLDRLLAEQK